MQQASFNPKKKHDHRFECVHGLEWKWISCWIVQKVFQCRMIFIISQVPKNEINPIYVSNQANPPHNLEMLSKASQRWFATQQLLRQCLRVSSVSYPHTQHLTSRPI